ncbi:hypothetical protein ACQJBY_018308 [Aegilops geniculata]
MKQMPTPVDQQQNRRRCCPLRRSRKGCMKGKGGPENQRCPFRGVRQRTWGRWVAEIREPNHGARLWLGTFASALDAARAYDAAARALYGDCARLNLAAPPLPPMTATLPLPHAQAQQPPAHSTDTNNTTSLCCSSSTSTASTTTPTNSGTFDIEWSYYNTAGALELGDFEAYVAGLPKAEDFGLEGFQEVMGD